MRQTLMSRSGIYNTQVPSGILSTSSRSCGGLLINLLLDLYNSWAKRKFNYRIILHENLPVVMALVGWIYPVFIHFRRRRVANIHGDNVDNLVYVLRGNCLTSNKMQMFLTISFAFSWFTNSLAEFSYCSTSKSLSLKNVVGEKKTKTCVSELAWNAKLTETVEEANREAYHD